MADARLRDLERRWRQTGSPADEAAFLLELARALDGPRGEGALLIAATASLPPVTRATWRDEDPRAPWDAWVGGLRGTSREAAGRVLLGPALAAYEVWSSGAEYGRGEWVTNTLWSMQEAIVDARRIDELEWREAFHAAFEAERAGRAQVARAVGHAARAFAERDANHAALAFRLAARASDGATVLAALRADVLPWVLGERDPVRERVLERGTSAGP